MIYICRVQKTNKTMNKPTTKRINFNEDILNLLRDRYGYSIDYIRKSLRGDRVGVMPDRLIKEYKKLESASKKALLQQANNLSQ